MMGAGGRRERKERRSLAKEGSGWEKKSGVRTKNRGCFVPRTFSLVTAPTLFVVFGASERVQPNHTLGTLASGRSGRAHGRLGGANAMYSAVVRAQTSFRKNSAVLSLAVGNHTAGDRSNQRLWDNTKRPLELRTEPWHKKEVLALVMWTFVLSSVFPKSASAGREES